MDLIPRLPNDVAIECLIRIPLQSLPASSKVSRGWKAEIERPEFCQRRKSVGSTQKIIVVGRIFVSDNPVTFCDLETGEWSDLPPTPDFTIKIVSVGSKLVAFGSRNSVFIFNFLSGIWRHGTPMPDDERFAFSCASDSDQMVYVAGGSDGVSDTSSSSALAYNVAKDEWKKLPNMNIGRVWCTGTFKDGMFHVIGGYLATNSELFGSKETFDVAMWRWNPVEEDFIEYPSDSTICVSGPHDAKMYMCEDRNVSIREGATWRVLVELPYELLYIRFATASQGKLFVIGFDHNYRVSPRVHVMDLKSYTWTSIDAPDDYLAHVISLCYLEI